MRSGLVGFVATVLPAQPTASSSQPIDGDIVVVVFRAARFSISIDDDDDEHEQEQEQGYEYGKTSARTTPRGRTALSARNGRVRENAATLIAPIVPITPITPLLTSPQPPPPDPSAAVLIPLAAQHGLADAAGDAVVVAADVRSDELLAGDGRGSASFLGEK